MFGHKRDRAYEAQHVALNRIQSRLADKDDPPDERERELLVSELVAMGPVRGSFGDGGRRGGIGYPGRGCSHLAPYPGCCKW